MNLTETSGEKTMCYFPPTTGNSLRSDRPPRQREGCFCQIPVRVPYPPRYAERRIRLSGIWVASSYA
ncbi:hypothetical protein BaRGS_00013859, partial [Batillaria attramentaria]